MEPLTLKQTAEIVWQRVCDGFDSIRELLLDQEIQNNDIEILLTPTTQTSYLVRLESPTGTETSPLLPPPYYLSEAMAEDKMSGFVSPTNEDQILYQCRGCSVQWSIPSSLLVDSEIDGVPIHAWRVSNGVPTRCLPCALVLGAIEKLNDLVFREPWLLTEGVAGKPEKQAWELAGSEMMDSGHGGSGRSSAGDGRTIQESMIFREKVMQSFMETAGEGFVELEESSEEKKGEK